VFDPLPRFAFVFVLVCMVASQTSIRAQYRAVSPIDIWRNVRRDLTAPDGDRYFSQMLHAEIPPQGLFDGKVISQPSSNELVVNVDNTAGDATLKFDFALQRVDPDTPVHFKGVIDGYTAKPYKLIFMVRDEDVAGLKRTP
jgi:hypothetical protein